MTHSFRTIKAILLKDLITEFRAKQILLAMIVLGLLITWILRLISEVATIDPRIIGPAALWIAFLFAALLGQDHSFALEHRHQCIAGLLLAPIDPGAIYLAKLIVNIIMLSVFELIVAPAVILAFNLAAALHVTTLIAVLILANIAISSVGVLFSAMVQLAPNRGSLLSILVLIILLPVMIPAVFALLFATGAIESRLLGIGTLTLVGDFSSALAYLIGFDVVFVTAGWLLFGFVTQD